jgi:hypothetical protein
MSAFVDISGMTIASLALAFSCPRGRRAVMVAFMMCQLAVETVLDDEPVSSSPSADWMKLLVAPKSNIASFMAATSLMASSMARLLAQRLF